MGPVRYEHYSTWASEVRMIPYYKLGNRPGESRWGVGGHKVGGRKRRDLKVILFVWSRFLSAALLLCRSQLLWVESLAWLSQFTLCLLLMTRQGRLSSFSLFPLVMNMFFVELQISHTLIEAKTAPLQDWRHTVYLKMLSVNKQMWTEKWNGKSTPVRPSQ